jgi:spore maturation protein CgeB
MRILISGRTHADSFARNISVSAQGMGHQVETVDPSPQRPHLGYTAKRISESIARAIPAVERRHQRSLVRQAQAFEPDLILITHGSLPPGIVRCLRGATRAKIALWFPDAVSNLGRQYLLAGDFDGWFFKDPYMAELFRSKLGLDAYYLPEACNPRWHRRTPLSAEERRKYGCALTTAGNMYYYRALMLGMFEDYDLKIWGSGYPGWLQSGLRRRYPGVYVAEVEKAKAFNAAKIVLNAMCVGEIDGVNCRLFEAAGCGAFQIADWKPALPDLFEPEREIVTFRTREELREKVDYYLARPAERQAIADRAYARAHREHTYEIRLQRMFELLGFSQVPTRPARDRAAAPERLAAVSWSNALPTH